MTLALVPFAVDQPRSLALASDALRTRLAPGENFADLWPPIDSAIRTSHATGGLVRSEGEALGIVVREPAGPLGVAVRLLYLSPPGAEVESYRAVLDLTEHAAGPIAFAPGPLAGLSAEEESTLMAGRGFAPYGRLEMGFPATAPLAPLPAVAVGDLRPVRPEDEPLLARLHENAYRNHLDRYLSIEDVDPAPTRTTRYGTISPGAGAFRCRPDLRWSRLTDGSWPRRLRSDNRPMFSSST